MLTTVLEIERRNEQRGDGLDRRRIFIAQTGLIRERAARGLRIDPRSLIGLLRLYVAMVLSGEDEL